ncbi:hypothetical protein M427DRAFT_473307 [Gonapodya prolifera JEL478]|uniref:BZIP domain-containing protein n=1 Tax=Gonapodya prolifera (strain JEL478) TaxID=1344416 RepID=A0A139AS39_GONPJ|nr:hypothetical protein M427DRAFT_473307 [Gonapodya prolifera JEL478]|eukprot:KXS19285.1 hypothetical protein M427DRAFT_473307 [Gonapodya prolifera JEL478]
MDAPHQWPDGVELEMRQQQMHSFVEADPMNHMLPMLSPRQTHYEQMVHHSTASFPTRPPEVLQIPFSTNLAVHPSFQHMTMSQHHGFSPIRSLHGQSVVAVPRDLPMAGPGSPNLTSMELSMGQTGLFQPQNIVQSVLHGGMVGALPQGIGSHQMLIGEAQMLQSVHRAMSRSSLAVSHDSQLQGGRESHNDFDFVIKREDQAISPSGVYEHTESDADELEDAVEWLSGADSGSASTALHSKKRKRKKLPASMLNPEDLKKRREQNVAAARKSRQKKMSQIASFEEVIKQLKRENKKLRTALMEVVSTRNPVESAQSAAIMRAEEVLRGLGHLTLAAVEEPHAEGSYPFPPFAPPQSQSTGSSFSGTFSDNMRNREPMTL